MRARRIILTSIALAILTHAAIAQKASGFNSATAIGHMAVTLLTPAALSNTRSLSFSNIGLPAYSSENREHRIETEMQTASVKVFGNNTTYNVSVPDALVFNGINGKGITLDEIFVRSESGFNGSGTIYIGAKMRIHNSKPNNESNRPMAVTINYN